MLCLGVAIEVEMHRCNEIRWRSVGAINLVGGGGSGGESDGGGATWGVDDQWGMGCKEEDQWLGRRRRKQADSAAVAMAVHHLGVG